MGIGVWRRRASPPCQSDESKGTWEDLKVGEFAPGGGGVQYQGPTGMVCREGWRGNELCCGVAWEAEGVVGGTLNFTLEIAQLLNGCPAESYRLLTQDMVKGQELAKSLGKKVYLVASQFCRFLACTQKSLVKSEWNFGGTKRTVSNCSQAPLTWFGEGRPVPGGRRPELSSLSPSPREPTSTAPSVRTPWHETDQPCPAAPKPGLGVRVDSPAPRALSPRRTASWQRWCGVSDRRFLVPAVRPHSWGSFGLLPINHRPSTAELLAAPVATAWGLGWQALESSATRQLWFIARGVAAP